METQTTAPDVQLSGARIIEALKQARVEYVLSVPDLHTSQGLLRPIANDSNLKLIRVCKEDECFGIAAGLSYANKRAVILVQYTGLLYAMNALRGVGCEQHHPVVMMVGLLGKEPGVAPTKSNRFGVKIIEPILDTMGVPHSLLDCDADIAQIGPAFDDAYSQSAPRALLIGRRPV